MANLRTIVIPADDEVVLERVQTGVRMEKRLMKVLRATADYKDLSLGDLLENIVGYSFGDLPSPFSATDLERIRQLKNVYYDEGENRSSPESRVFHHIIRLAHRDGSREVRLEPREDGFVHVYYSRDGEMKDLLRLPTHTTLEPLSQHIKAMVGIGAAKNKKSQEALVRIEMPDGVKYQLFIRVDSLPSGDNIILRLKNL